MADDLVISVRQIAQYQQQLVSAPGDMALVQSGGLGGNYLSMLVADMVGTALQQGGSLHLAPGNSVAWNGAILTWDNGVFVFSEPVFAPAVDAEALFVNGQPVITLPEFQLFAAIPKVDSFNGRTGIVQLNESDILRAGGILQNNPRFSGMVIVPTPWDYRNDTMEAANCAWVQGVIEALICSGSIVQSFNGRGGEVVLTAADVTAALTVPGQYAYANSPALGDASGRIATTMFVDETVTNVYDNLVQLINDQTDLALVGYAPLNSPNFTGVPTAPTAVPGSSTGQLATTAFVQAAVTAATTGVSSFNTRTGAVTLQAADVTGVGGALLVSPTFTGNPQGPTRAPGDNTTALATTAFVHAAVAAATAGVTSFNTRTGAVTLVLADITGAGGAPLAAPAFTGIPTAPTAAPATNTTQVATTAFVQAAVGATVAGVSSFNARTGAVNLIAADVSAAGGALVNSPTFTGVPAAPTAAPGTASTQLATTAFVANALTSSGVASFNGRTGAVTLVSADISGAGGALLASPAFSGTPTAPTASTGTANTQIATTAFVMNAVGGSVVSSFNGRSGAVTLAGADITGAGGALLAGPAFSGIPTAPTATAGTNTAQLATTAFVQAALGGGGVVNTFNGRSGAVTLLGSDVSAAGGALIASPTFTGTPSAPTAVTGTASNQLATCQFVINELGTLGGVTTFNGRSGNITLTAADITSATGALLASPTFTGAPAAPTAAPGTSTTQLATTAFVNAAITGMTTLTQADTAPTVSGNQLWFDSVGGQLYVQYIDPTTSAKSWVVANSPQPVTQPPAAGTRVLLGSAVVNPASPAATVDFPNVFTSAYDEYAIDFYGVAVPSAASLNAAFFTGGATVISGGSYYSWATYYANSNNSGAGGGGAANVMGLGYAANSLTTQTNLNLDGKMRIVVPWRTDVLKLMTHNAQAYGSAGVYTFQTSFYLNSNYTANITTALSGIRFLASTGNLLRGVFNIYGIVKASALV